MVFDVGISGDQALGISVGAGVPWCRFQAAVFRDFLDQGSGIRV